MYLDFRKAVNLGLTMHLLAKRNGYGTVGNVLDWIRAFLSAKIQKVTVGEENPVLDQVISGIPQGYILGPVLFTLFCINDLQKCVESVCKIFEDNSEM